MPGCVWLDSGGNSALARYTYLSADPFVTLRLDKPQPDSLRLVRDLLHKFHQPKSPDLPPMQGGWMGWFGYGLGSCFERLPLAQHNEFGLPLAHLGLYDVILCWDHLANQGWIISQGWPATTQSQRRRHAYRRLTKFLELLESKADASPNSGQLSNQNYEVRPSRLSQQHETRWGQDWTSNFSSEGFRQAVGKCVDYIHQGDIFQVNLSQRLLHRASCSSPEAYQRLRSQNPAPFGGYADFGRLQVMSTSPERFVSLIDGQVETRPIKGTRPRFSNPTADHGMAQLLQASQKDRSENVMIVDLLRNDLSRVSAIDSVEVTELCRLERYAYVWHLVSVVRSQLGDGYDATDLIQAAFPGGSITGAPKIRAMEIIAELEPTVRGPYCGSLGYLSFAGDMDLNILIRTVTAGGGWWQLPVGGGIVADSQPLDEEQETWHKAEGMLRALAPLRASA